jgi:hypothetical protein
MRILIKKILKHCWEILFISIVVCGGFTALAQTEFLSTEPVSTPILAIDAGVLPTSPFYFLDKFDEWVQKNIFTFGINSFRAQVFMQSSAEKISELQFLNAQGMLTDKIAQKLLKAWENDLAFSASLVGEEYLHGRRPINLTDEIFRTMLASADAIQLEFNGKAIGGDDALVLSDNFLDEAEKKIIASLLPENAGIPEGVLKLVSDNMVFDVRQMLKKSIISTDDESGIAISVVGGQLLRNSVVENQKIAQAYYDNGDYRNAIGSYSDCRLALRLMTNRNLAIEPMAFTDMGELEIRLDQAMMLLTNSGLINADELALERTRILGTYRNI